MKKAPIKGDTAHADKERASRRQPEGSNFPSPVDQHVRSYRSKRADDTYPVSQDATDQQDVVFHHHSRAQIVIARLRRNQITALLQHRCSGPCLTDDAILFLEEILPQMAIACEQLAFDYNIAEWVQLNTPRLTEAEIADARARILPNPPRYASTALGLRLRVTQAEVERLELTHIHHVGWTKAAHGVKRRTKKAAAVRLKRLASGETKTPRELSILALKPWTLPSAPCTSRKTFYDMPKAAQVELTAKARRAYLRAMADTVGTDLSPILFIHGVDKSVPTSCS